MATSKHRTAKGVPDHCELTELDRASLVDNTRTRFKHDEIYTQVGDGILIAVNPFATIDGLYGPKAMEQCRGCRLGEAKLGPHLSLIHI